MGACFGRAYSFGEEFCQQNIWRMFLRVKFHGGVGGGGWQKRILGSKKVLERKDMGSEIFLEKICIFFGFSIEQNICWKTAEYFI